MRSSYRPSVVSNTVWAAFCSRLIGIEIPEEGKKEAREFIENLMCLRCFGALFDFTEEVYLEFDDQQKDKYGRTLVYMFMSTMKRILYLISAAYIYLILTVFTT